MQNKRINALFDILVFPEGKTKAFTMSYDDGTIHDRKLVEIMNQYGVKGTFNLNAGFLDTENILGHEGRKVDIGRVSAEEIASLYKGHEVAGHGYYHGSPVSLGSSAVMQDTIRDKYCLEQIVGKIVRGYAYPFGHYTPEIKELLRLAGYRYARVVPTTESFDLPKDFYEWMGTCHHANPRLMELAEEFCEGKEFMPVPKLFYLWGHSYEFAGEDNWNVIEDCLAYISGFADQIWFASNIEICDYISAYRQLEYSAAADMIYNPTATDLWIMRDGKTIKLAAGETCYPA